MDKINKIYNENCLKTMSCMPDDFIDLTVTSPPYDNLRDYNGYDFDFESVAKGLFRVTQKGGVVVWVVGDQTIDGSETGSSFKQALYFKEIGFNLHDTMIYQKKSCYAHDPRNKRYKSIFEYMFVFTKGMPQTYNEIKDTPNKHAGKIISGTKGRDKKGNKRAQKNFLIADYQARSNVWNIPSSEKSEHPAIFPEQLANDHIITWSNENDLIYDPFMGSGTTAKMAIINKRNFICSEISSEYCEIANERIKSYLEQGVLF